MRVTPPCAAAIENEGECYEDGHQHPTSYLPLGAVFLPHSCDEWVIGGEAEITALIADLQAIRAKLQEES